MPHDRCHVLQLHVGQGAGLVVVIGTGYLSPHRCTHLHTHQCHTNPLHGCSKLLHPPLVANRERNQMITCLVVPFQQLRHPCRDRHHTLLLITRTLALVRAHRNVPNPISSANVTQAIPIDRGCLQHLGSEGGYMQDSIHQAVHPRLIHTRHRFGCESLHCQLQGNRRCGFEYRVFCHTRLLCLIITHLAHHPHHLHLLIRSSVSCHVLLQDRTHALHLPLDYHLPGVASALSGACGFPWARFSESSKQLVVPLLICTLGDRVLQAQTMLLQERHNRVTSRAQLIVDGFRTQPRVTHPNPFSQFSCFFHFIYFDQIPLNQFLEECFSEVLFLQRKPIVVRKRIPPLTMPRQIG